MAQPRNEMVDKGFIGVCFPLRDGAGWQIKTIFAAQRVCADRGIRG